MTNNQKLLVCYVLYLDNQVGMKFVLDSKRGRNGNVLEGFVPEVRTNQTIGTSRRPRSCFVL